MNQTSSQEVDQLTDSYADNFDLSLLPMDNEIDLISDLAQSHTNISESQRLSHLDTDSRPTEYRVNSTPLSPTQQQQRESSNIATINTESGSLRTQTSSPCPVSSDYIPQTVFDKFHCIDDKQQTYDQFFVQSNQYPYYSNTFIPPQKNFFAVLPPSPTPSIEFNSNFVNIKREQTQNINFGLYPPSPPDSNGAPSPIGHHLSDVKSEPYDIGNETSIDINSFFPNTFDLATNALTPTSSPSSVNSLYSTAVASHEHLAKLELPLSLTPPIDQRVPKRDHQLLREYLQDTTFQRRHNLKPIALESLFVGDWDARGDIEPVISLALEHARKDVQQTCIALNISPGEQHH